MKSNVSDLLGLMEAILADAFITCAAEVPFKRDLETIRARVEDEGLSFLTLTLPKFATDLERGLADGKLTATLFARWKRRKGSAVMPAFLQEITRHIFDFETGEVKDNECPPNSVSGGTVVSVSTCVGAIRQICMAFKKVGIACSPEREAAAIDGFIANEQTLQEFSIPESDAARFLAVSDVLWGNLFGDFNHSEILPRHGPGATAERILGNQKYLWRRWHERLEQYFPIVETGFPLGVVNCKVDDPDVGHREPLEELNDVLFVSQDAEQPVRVVLVPKTLKGPRVIAIEPACMQYVQQGIRAYLYRKVEGSVLARFHVNFRNQGVNRKLALESSVTGRLATIDLSDASDRVPRSLAMEMFRCAPLLRECIDACRSMSAELPTGQVIPDLKKFASMGSALCFPVEAMYFYTVCIVALLEISNLPATFRNIFEVSRELYVYGDDILVPATNAAFVIETLAKYNAKANANKSFWTGKFRESCGLDAYCGEQVTPVYIRTLCPNDKRQAREIVSWNASANLFYLKGYWRASTFIRNRLEGLLGDLPHVSMNTACVGRISFLGLRSVSEWDDETQSLKVRGFVPRAKRRTDAIAGYAALTKVLLSAAWREESETRFASERRLGADLTLDDFVSGLEKPTQSPFINISGVIKDDLVKIEDSLLQSVQRGAVALKRRGVPVQLG